MHPPLLQGSGGLPLPKEKRTVIGPGLNFGRLKFTTVMWRFGKNDL